MAHVFGMRAEKEDTLRGGQDSLIGRSGRQGGSVDRLMTRVLSLVCLPLYLSVCLSICLSVSLCE